MALSTIKTAIAARIAAATSATSNTELAILKVLGKKLNLNTSSITALSNTKSDAVTGATDLKDLLMLSQGITDYYGASYIGELRMFNTGVADITMDDGSRWLKTGVYETDTTKWDSRYWPYSLVTSAGTNTGWSQKSGGLVAGDREIVVLNSGKKIAFPFNTSVGTVTSFTDPTVAPAVVKSANANYVDYSYDADTDTLWLLQGAGAGLTKITSDGTVVAEIAATTYAGASNATARSICAKNGKVFIGLSQLVRRSYDNGATWASHTVTGLPTSYIVGLGYNPANDVLFAICQAGGSMQIESTASHTFAYSTANGNWVTVSPQGFSSNYLKGFVLNTFSLGKYVLFNQSYSYYDGTQYTSYNWIGLFDTVAKKLVSLYADSYAVAFKITKLFRMTGSNKVFTYTFNSYNGLSSISIYDFDIGESVLGVTSFSTWSVSFTLPSSKSALGGYVEANKLVFFSPSDYTKFLEKVALVGSAPMTGFSHIRIS
jgi:hypothetical protein